MRYRVDALEGALLDAAVARAEGMTQMEGGWYSKDGVFCSAENWRPSRSWAWGGPIIERERIALYRAHEDSVEWEACVGGFEDMSGGIDGPGPVSFWDHGPTPLIAAMRAYVASKLGIEVELP